MLLMPFLLAPFLVHSDYITLSRPIPRSARMPQVSRYQNSHITHQVLHPKHVTVVSVDFSVFSDVSEDSFVFWVLSDVRHVTHLVITDNQLNKQ